VTALAADQLQRVDREATRVLADHRRTTQARICTGCTWTAPPGMRSTSSPEATRRRHEAFNQHLVAALRDALTG
jgi:hypothetical protein